ncbi:ATP-grasp domain-containing protein [Brevibacillus massiliensis]|jgi:carbamoyl-phosphate synthase large subunit|uniref:ATP-grasp domain-containing protein n=1 Tax=Brevibacillus massiliensis TaxID=1118054 RepID=UPI0002F40CE9|nr:ATP-grasp domain-containing protein [Brevibacillus massiliensis]
MNILLASVGRRVRLLQYFKAEWADLGQVVAVDCDVAAPALHAADRFEIVPGIDSADYIDTLLEICKKHQIAAVLSLIDPELVVLSRYKEAFLREKVQVVVSDSAVTEMCLDKWKMYQFFQASGVPCVSTHQGLASAEEALAAGTLSFPLLVKPRKGSASQGLCRADSLSELQTACSHSGEVVIQPYVSGDEYGVDAYMDLISAAPVAIFSKKKLRMRAGETDKSLAVRDERLTELVLKTLKAVKPVGPIDIDCFYTPQGFVVSEMNPRFGGGYPHAHECGFNFVRYLLRNLQGRANDSRLTGQPEGSVMLKYDQIMIV